jgi:2-polyprenyl-6-methoxyphenol hydroxylase-like FAD-dependent oxidoreductase
MTSIALRRLGHTVTIYERSPTPLLHDQGAGVVAGGEVQQFMSKYDNTKRPVAVTSKQRLYLNKAGDVIDCENSVQRMTSWDLLYFVARANFDQVDSEYLEGRKVPEKGGGEGRYEYGREVMGINEEGDRVKVSFEYVRDQESKGTEDVVADLIIIADGASSNMRRLLSPSSLERKYAGYVAFRGTVPETELSKSATAVFVEKFPFFHSKGAQILAYTIPGHAGILEVGKRLVNWVWYVNVAEDSQDYKNIMTDKDGNTHRYTLPTGGKMRDEVWTWVKWRAREDLPPQYAELVEKTTSPFVQAITDLEPPKDGKSWYLDGKAVLVGDAFSGFRPHTAASTSQAAMHALLVGEIFAGNMGRKEYENRVYDFARKMQRKGVELGERSQFGRHPLSS